MKELKIPGGKAKSKPTKLKPLEGAKKKKKEKVKNLVDDFDYEDEMAKLKANQALDNQYA